MRPCVRLCVCVCAHTCSMGVSEHECICMHVNVGCVLAEFLTQTGHEKGTLDCCLSTAEPAWPAATQLTVNQKHSTNPGVKEIFWCVTYNLKAFLHLYVMAQAF